MSAVIASASFLAWVTIEVMSYLNPSNTTAIVAAADWVVPVFVVTAGVAFVFPFFASVQGRVGFFPLFFGSFATLMVVTWLSGVMIHRDFLAFTTPAVLIYVTIFLRRIPDLHIVTRNRVATFARISSAVTVVFVLWIVWIMMMSYAIVTRTEPRWIESIAYNLVNGIIGILFLYVGTTLRERGKRTVIRCDGDWFIDDRNISELLSFQENRIVSVFLTQRDQTVTCYDLAAELRSLAEHAGGRLGGHPPGSVERRLVTAEDCERCLAVRRTATTCHTYRNLNNRIADTKKYLELLGVGTIVPAAENPRDVKEHGWRLRLFDDVTIGRSVRRSQR